MSRIAAEATPVTFFAVNVNNAASISSIFELPGKIVSLETPAAARGAAWYVQGSSEPGGTFARVKDRSNTVYAISATTRTAQFFAVEPAKLFGVRYCRIESNSAQGATVTVNVGYVR